MADKDLGRLLALVDANPPARDEELATAEVGLGHALPQHYRRFLRTANGCEGALGDGYVALWGVDELEELNDAYAVQEFVPGLLLVGSDGGDTAYALDLTAEDSPVVELPFVPMDREHMTVVGPDIAALLAAVEAT